METTNLGLMLNIAALAAEIILENGAETYRVEDTVRRLCKSYGYQGAEVVALSTAVFISITAEGRSESVIRRVPRRSLNLARVDAVNDLSRRAVYGEVSMEVALSLLKSISRSETLAPLKGAALAGLSAGFFALMFGGSLAAFFVALVCGFAAQATGSALRRRDIPFALVSLLGAVICSLLTMVASFWMHFTPEGVETALAGAIMPMITGLLMTNAARDALRGDLLSAQARGFEALLVAIMVALGISLPLRFYLPTGVVMSFADPPSNALSVLYAGIASLFYCPLLKIPKKTTLAAALLGALTYASFLFLVDRFSMSDPAALFITSAAASLLCEALARRTRIIATVYLCAALIPLVPGLDLYRMMRELLLKENAVALSIGLSALFQIGAIALGAAVGSLPLGLAREREKG